VRKRSRPVEKLFPTWKSVGQAAREAFRWNWRSVTDSVFKALLILVVAAIFILAFFGSIYLSQCPVQDRHQVPTISR
jgi:hypothetical protein